jgi:hypothetical protein
MGVVLDVLRERLETNSSPLIGCVRRNVWTLGDEKPWKMIRGNAILHAYGEKASVRVLGEKITYYQEHNFLLQFRAGEFKDHWIQEINELATLIRWAGGDLADTSILLQENRGE